MSTSLSRLDIDRHRGGASVSCAHTHCPFCGPQPPADTVGEGGRALIAWFNVDAIQAGLARVCGMHDRRWHRTRRHLLSELREKHPERITRWWNR